MFKLRTKKKVAPMHVVPGDTIRVHYKHHDEKTGKLVREETLDHLIDKTDVYDTLAILEFEDELGFKNGYAAVVGNE